MSTDPTVSFAEREGRAGLPAIFKDKAWKDQKAKMSGGKPSKPHKLTEMEPRPGKKPERTASGKPPPNKDRKVRPSASKVIASPGAGPISTQAHVFSRNWAGSIVPALGGRRFTAIAGSWRVPDIGAKTDEWSLVSIWVGLGGARQASRSMPQIGSEHGWIDGEPVHRLWCQWWLGSDSAGYLSHLVETDAPLAVGEEITCSLSVDSSGMNVAFLWAHGGKRYETTGTSTRPVMADTANWIVERPTEVWAEDVDGGRRLKLGSRYPLPPFSEVVTMEGCLARLGVPLGQGINAASAIDRRPADGKLLSMRSTLPSGGRSFIELEPVVPKDRKAGRLQIIRHQP